jgi:hypothetical protein
MRWFLDTSAGADHVGKFGTVLEIDGRLFQYSAKGIDLPWLVVPSLCPLHDIADGVIHGSTSSFDTLPALSAQR